MLLGIAIAVLFLISFLWALWSLGKETSKIKEVEKTKKDLAREKILFKR